MKFLLELSIFIIVALSAANAQTLNPLKPYCFQFSWLGPKYNNESVFGNATCDDVTNLATNVPCRQPLVVTYDGTPPDMKYLWDNHKTEVSCLLTNDDVCVSYENLFGGFVQSITYMCTKVIDENEKAITSGCKTMKQGSRQVKICMCKSTPDSFPCNSSNSVLTSGLLLIFTIYLLSIM